MRPARTTVPGMKRFLLPVLFVAVGIALIIRGHQREESVVGIADQVGADLANAWDGKARQPDHVWYYAGGGVLLLIGATLALRHRGTKS